MLALRRYYVNPFGDPKIGVDRLVAFAVDHVGKMVAANASGAFNEMIALTQALVEALGGRISEEMTRKAIRKARTAALKAKRVAIHKELTRVDAGVRGMFEKGSPEYVGIFPQGLVGFRRAAVDELGGLLDALLVAMGPHVPGIGTADGIAGLAAEWKALRGDLLVKKGAATSAAAQRRAAVKALRERLFKNLLELAGANAGRPEDCRRHFAQHLLGQGGAR